ncbi:hypothetical protein H4R19_006239 [Coemansia spiralis]|nr:hypothetical protein H4R19_006239 [Coemansia spiralis]
MDNRQRGNWVPRPSAGSAVVNNDQRPVLARPADNGMTSAALSLAAGPAVEAAIGPPLPLPLPPLLPLGSQVPTSAELDLELELARPLESWDMLLWLTGDIGSSSANCDHTWTPTAPLQASAVGPQAAIPAVGAGAPWRLVERETQFIDARQAASPSGSGRAAAELGGLDLEQLLAAPAPALPHWPDERRATEPHTEPRAGGSSRPAQGKPLIGLLAT